MLQVHHPDFVTGIKVGRRLYQSEYKGTPVLDNEVTDLLRESFSLLKRVSDASVAKDMPASDEYYAGFVTGCLEAIFLEAKERYIYLTCSHEHVEKLVNELEHQLIDSSVAIDDWGWSSKRRAGYIVLFWGDSINPNFEKLIGGDSRIESITIRGIIDEPIKSDCSRKN